MTLTITGLGPRLHAAPSADRRRFARACVRHARAALSTDARRGDLAALLNLPDVDQLARWPPVPRHAWGTGGLGPARRALWGAAYWAMYPAEPFSPFASDKQPGPANGR